MQGPDLIFAIAGPFCQALRGGFAPLLLEPGDARKTEFCEPGICANGRKRPSHVILPAPLMQLFPDPAGWVEARPPSRFCDMPFRLIWMGDRWGGICPLPGVCC